MLTSATLHDVEKFDVKLKHESTKDENTKKRERIRE
jgi:hypothetical protein